MKIKCVTCHYKKSDGTDSPAHIFSPYSPVLREHACTLIRKFSVCSVDVKCALYRAYVTPLYTAHLWSSYRVKSMQRLKVAYNDAMRLLLRVPRWHSASQLFVSSNIPTCQALLRKLMFNFICRLDLSDNCIIKALTGDIGFRFTSRLRRHWHISLRHS